MTFLFWLFSRLPLSVLQALGGWLGALAAKVPGRYHDRLIANFRHAYPDATPAMLKEAARSAGRMVFEMPYFWVRKNGADVAPHLFNVCRPIIERALADGRGLIFLTPHLGCFEVLPQAYAREHPVTSLFKPPHKPLSVLTMMTARFLTSRFSINSWEKSVTLPTTSPSTSFINVA